MELESKYDLLFLLITGENTFQANYLQSQPGGGESDNSSSDGSAKTAYFLRFIWALALALLRRPTGMGGEVAGGGLGEVHSELGLYGRLLGRPEPVPCDSQSVQAIANHHVTSQFYQDVQL
jgi:hypothetical protein